MKKNLLPVQTGAAVCAIMLMALAIKRIELKVCQWELLPTNLSAPGGVYGPRRTTVLNPPPNVTTSTSSPSWSFLDAIGISRPTFFFNFSAEGHSSLGHCFFHHMSFPTN